jgi:UDP-N-acetylmuramoylalanine--D-glutamate ligase
MNDPMDTRATATGAHSVASVSLLEARQGALSGQSPHRMEHVRVVDGVTYINDSASTFLDAALHSISGLEVPIVWLVGDLDPAYLYGDVRSLVDERVSAVIAFGDDAPEREEALRSIAPRAHAVRELRTAVFLARELAAAGEAVLFCPACPSGNGFANYEERGAEFRRAVNDLHANA